MMKSLAVVLLLLSSTAAFAIDHPGVMQLPQPSMQDLAARAALRSAVEREHYEETIQQLQQELRELKKDAAPKANADPAPAKE